MVSIKLEGIGVKHTKDSQVIADQARQIFVFESLLDQYLKNVRKVNNMLYCIGGPLNDNKLGYTKEQMQIFFHIQETLEMVYEDEDADE